MAKSTLNPFAESGEPIAADYFFQKAPPLTETPERVNVPITKPSIGVSRLSKPARAPKPKIVKNEPIPPLLLPANERDPIPLVAESTANSRPEAEPQPAIMSGVTLILRTVQFEQSSYVLMAEASTELDKLVRSMKANSHWHIHIAGHIDNVGDPRLNLALSVHWAKVVATYLNRRGIVDERITTDGFGSS